MFVFILEFMVGGVVTKIIPGSYGMIRIFKAQSTLFRSPCDIYIFERYPRVFPLGDDGGFEDNGNTGLCCQVVTDSTGDIFYSKVYWKIE